MEARVQHSDFLPAEDVAGMKLRHHTRRLKRRMALRVRIYGSDEELFAVVRRRLGKLRVLCAGKVLLRGKDGHPSQRKSARLVAVQSDQELSAKECELLEDRGVVVVQVPASVLSGSNEDVARYLAEQLNAGVRATEDRIATLKASEEVSEALGLIDRTPSGEEEEALLELLNDPASQLGAPS